MTAMKELETDKLYRIAGWEEHYEKSQSKRAKNHHWVAMPIKHDGSGFRRISIQDNATDLFAAWCLIVQVGAKCKTRGVLSDSDGVPLDAEDLAIKTGFPISIFNAAFEFFSGDKVRWLICSAILRTPSETENTPSETANSASENAHNTVHNITDIQDEEEDFPAYLARLEADPSIENAIAAIYASHDSFKTVQRHFLENSLAGQPDRNKWPEAIANMAAKYAGAELNTPNRALQNWLAGPIEKTQKQVDRLHVGHSKDPADYTFK